MPSSLPNGSCTDPNLVILSGGRLVPVGLGPEIDCKTGQYVPDPAGPRRTTYSQSGLVYNIGFRYTPSRRSLLELRVGQRFSDLVITGTVRQQLRGGLLITGSLIDGIETFNSVLTRIIDGVPTSFTSNGIGGNAVGGCVKGPSTTDPTGCLNGDTQSVSSGVFRSRIGRLGADLNRGRTTYALEYTYLNRRYLDAGETAGAGGIAPVSGAAKTSRSASSPDSITALRTGSRARSAFSTAITISG